MTTVLSSFNMPAQEGDVGIEIEAEGTGLDYVETKTWCTKHDGSLRGGYPECSAEFVIKNTIPVDGVAVAIVELNEALPKAKFTFSHRCSVHVHVNVQQLSRGHLINFIYLSSLFENALFNFAGPMRKGNRFCSRVYDSYGIVQTYEFLANNKLTAFNKIKEGDHKYAALNLCAVQKYGSVEFRHMHGTVDVATITNWCKILVSLREKAKQFSSIKEIFSLLKEVKAAAFAKSILVDSFDLLNYPEMCNDVSTVAKLLITLPAKYVEFKEPVVSKEEPKPIKQKPAPKIINALDGLQVRNAIERPNALNAAARKLDQGEAAF